MRQLVIGLYCSTINMIKLKRNYEYLTLTMLNLLFFCS